MPLSRWLPVIVWTVLSLVIVGMCFAVDGWIVGIPTLAVAAGCFFFLRAQALRFHKREVERDLDGC